MGGRAGETATSAHRPPDAGSGAVGRATRERSRQRVHTFAVRHFVGLASGGDSRTQPTCKQRPLKQQTRNDNPLGASALSSLSLSGGNGSHRRHPLGRSLSSPPPSARGRETHTVSIYMNEMGSRSLPDSPSRRTGQEESIASNQHRGTSHSAPVSRAFFRKRDSTALRDLLSA